MEKAQCANLNFLNETYFECKNGFNLNINGDTQSLEENEFIKIEEIDN